MEGKAGSRGGCLKEEGRGPGNLLQTKADFSQLVYEEICSKCCCKMHGSFMGRTQKNS